MIVVVQLSDTNCKSGECCCQNVDGSYNLVFTGSYATASSSCRDSTCASRFPTDCTSSYDCGNDKVDEATVAAPAWTESFTTTEDYCYYSDCQTNFPLKCTGYGDCSGKKIDKDWAAPADDQMGGCKLCCGFEKQDVCSGNKVDNGVNSQIFAEVGKYSMYAALLVLVGISPAILSAVGKLKGTDANGNSPLENVCGTLSIFSVGCCGVLGAGAVSAFVFFVGAVLQVLCEEVKNDPNYSEAVADSCSTECAAARTHQLEAICNSGTAASGASTVVALAVVLSVCTSILVCIGFCNKKRRTVQPIIIMQQGGVQMQQMQQSQQWVQQNQQPQQMQQAQAVVVVPEVK